MKRELKAVPLGGWAGGPAVAWNLMKRELKAELRPLDREDLDHYESHEERIESHPRLRHLETVTYLHESHEERIESGRSACCARSGSRTESHEERIESIFATLSHPGPGAKESHEERIERKILCSTHL